MVPSYGGSGAGESKALVRAYERASQGLSAGSDDGHGHSHDPARKNDLSQSDEAGDTTDPTTPREAERAIRAVEMQRAEPDPELTTVSPTPSRTTFPGSR